MACMGGESIFIQNFGGGELRVKRPCRRPRHRWKDNIKMYLKGKGRESGLAEDRNQW
jgi:hypothetical protein